MKLSPTSKRLLIVARAFTNRRLSFNEAIAIIEHQLREQHKQGHQTEDKTLVVIISLPK